MNYRLISKYLGFFTLAIGVLMLPSILWAIYYDEWSAFRGFLLSILITAGIAFGLLKAGSKASTKMFQREALFMVTASWFVAAFVGAIPFMLIGRLGPIDAFFESMSGFTTTGSTIITNIEGQAKSLLFWRSFTQWIGGVGIVVLAVAVLPYLGAGGKQLYKTESTGTDPRGITPRIKDTASMLYKTYLVLTILMTVSLVIAGMTFYDAICHTLTTLSTGGFSTKQFSIAAFNSPLIEWIIIFFMIVAGTSLSLIFLMFTKDWKTPFKDAEWKTYVGIIGVGILIITANVFMGPHTQYANDVSAEEGYSFLTSFRITAFQVVSIVTGTGFSTHDYDQWPHFSRMLLFMFMFLGGCAGSTAGGIKMVRVHILAKMAFWRIENTFTPKTVRAVRINDNVIDDDTRKSVNTFFVIYIACFVVGSIFMSAFGMPLGMPFESAMGSVAATLNNIGPGFADVGPMKDFSLVPGIGKLFLSLCMVLGRLELFCICVFFIPDFWRSR